MRGLRMASELRVPDFVTPVAKHRRAVSSHEEVRFPTPAVRCQHSLIDDIGSGGHLSFSLASPDIPIQSIGAACDSRNPKASSLKVTELCHLVSGALGSEQLGFGGSPSLERAASRHFDFEPSQVLALQEVC